MARETCPAILMITSSPAPDSASSVTSVCRLSCHRPTTPALSRTFVHAALRVETGPQRPHPHANEGGHVDGRWAPRANVVQTCGRKCLPLVARTALALNVFSNTYRLLPQDAARSGGFEPRRPRQSSL